MSSHPFLLSPSGTTPSTTSSSFSSPSFSSLSSSSPLVSTLTSPWGLLATGSLIGGLFGWYARSRSWQHKNNHHPNSHKFTTTPPPAHQSSPQHSQSQHSSTHPHIPHEQQQQIIVDTTHLHGSVTVTATHTNNHLDIPLSPSRFQRPVSLPLSRRSPLLSPSRVLTDIASESERAHVLSQAESMSIRLQLKESLQKIFSTIDTDGDGVIHKQDLINFLKTLGLTGDREQAIIDIVGEEQQIEQKKGKDTAASAASTSGITWHQFMIRFHGLVTEESEEEEEPTEQIEEAAETGVDGISQDESVSPLPPSHEHDLIRIRHITPRTHSPSSSNTPSPPTLSPTSSKRTSLQSSPVQSKGPNSLSVDTSSPHHHAHNGSIQPSPLSLSSPSSTSSTPAPSIRVFLGGACGATTWRQRVAIPLLQTAGITYFNPQVKDWHPDLMALEGLMKAWCKTLLFVIGRSTRSLASMIEAASLIAAGRKVILVVRMVDKDRPLEGGIVPSPSEVKDLNRAREYLMEVAKTYSTPIYKTVEEAVKHIIQLEQEEKRERLQRMASLHKLKGTSTRNVLHQSS